MKKITIINSTLDTSIDGGGVAQVVRSIYENLNKTVNSKVICRKAWVNHENVLQGEMGHDYIDNITNNSNVILHSHGIWDMFSKKTCEISLKRNIPLILSPHGMLEPWAIEHKKYKKKIAWYTYQKRLIKSANLLVVNSDREYRSVRKLGFENPIAIVGNGVERENNISPIEFKNRDKVILFLSRISEVKGIPDLIKAWSMISDHKGYQLHLCGNGEENYIFKIKGLIAESGLTDSIKYLGPIFSNDKWKKYESSHLFVLPSYSENFGIVIAEALMSGLPIITSHSAPWKILKEKEIGWSIDNDCVQLSSAISNYINLNIEQKFRLNSLTRSYSEASFDWGNVVNDYLECYRWVLGIDKKPPKSINFT